MPGLTGHLHRRTRAARGRSVPVIGVHQSQIVSEFVGHHGVATALQPDVASADRTQATPRRTRDGGKTDAIPIIVEIVVTRGGGGGARMGIKCPEHLGRSRRRGVRRRWRELIPFLWIRHHQQRRDHAHAVKGVVGRSDEEPVQIIKIPIGSRLGDRFLRVIRKGEPHIENSLGALSIGEIRIGGICSAAVITRHAARGHRVFGRRFGQLLGVGNRVQWAAKSHDLPTQVTISRLLLDGGGFGRNPANRVVLRLPGGNHVLGLGRIQNSERRFRHRKTVFQCHTPQRHSGAGLLAIAQAIDIRRVGASMDRDLAQE